MTKKRNTLQSYSIILIIVSVTLLFLGSLASGYMLSKDQVFSPLPSVEGIMTGLAIALVLSGFVTYAVVSFYRSTSDNKPYNIVSIGTGAVLISLLIQHLVRITV